MKHAGLLLAALLLVSPTVSAQVGDFAELPPGALVLETRGVPSSNHSNRQLGLWMKNPEVHEQKLAAESYTCLDGTRGSSFYRGPTRISLFDTLTQRIINTVEIKLDTVPNGPGADVFDIPHWVKPGYYSVEPPLRSGEGQAIVMDLKDYNGDGRPLEFALFNAQSCTVFDTQLIGYSERQDRVIQYSIHLTGEWSRVASHPTVLWLDSVFLQKPVRPGVWNYTRYYDRMFGRLKIAFGARAVFDIQYDPAGEAFLENVEWERVWPIQREQ